MNTGSLGSSGLGISAVPGLGLGAPARFDPAGFGEKLFSAARDGVDRMGTGSPSLNEEAKATMEGNLKSIGKFFRRDMSGFGGMGIGGRFGGRSADDGNR
jgi:vacuolar protein sorting-associated protein 53